MLFWTQWRMTCVPIGRIIIIALLPNCMNHFRYSRQRFFLAQKLVQNDKKMKWLIQNDKNHPWHAILNAVKNHFLVLTLGSWLYFLSSQSFPQNRYRMFCLPFCSIVNLMSATGSVSRDNCFRRAFSNSGKKALFPDVHTYFIMLFFISEGAGHPAATRGNNGDLVIFWKV